MNEPVELLDRVKDRLSTGEHSAGMRDLFQGLLRVRARTIRDGWADFATQHAIAHPLREVIHLDPMCRRSFEKPRGYAGDAVLLDYIYRIRSASEAPPLGRAVHEYAVNRPAACAVRHRRDWLAYILDRAVDESGHDARVMSIACGHLREAELSAAVKQGWLRELIAIDADERSLEVAATSFPEIVKPVAMSVGRLMARYEQFGRFHFVYSAGLFDYLEERVAKKLVGCMFDMLEPGGRLVFSNFLPKVQDAGYMETYMGWQLIYRDLATIEDLTAELPDDDVAERKVYEDPFGAIGYAEVQRV